MFGTEDAKKKVLAELTLNDGRILVGHLVLPVMSDLVRSMNNDTKFIQYEGFDGMSRLIAKSAIVDVTSKHVPKVPKLDDTDASVDLDPFKTLGLPPGATPAEARAAYLKLTKQYHPDQYTNVGLPAEVVRYMSAVFSRSNIAYNMIKGGEFIEAA